MSKQSLIFISALFWFSVNLNADVITDGSLGTRIELPGLDYKIGAELGQQHGGNLFHSFETFNLNANESATFSAGVDSGIQNVFSRVTGENPSQIDGLIRSTILNADMYFLNPYGIMFGPNARLNVQGSFYASTANYLRLGNGGRFDALNPNDSLLTVAPVEAFGFLEQSEKIEIQDSLLETPVGKTLSLIGGNISIEDGVLSAKSGRINLASVASAGEVILTPDALQVTAIEKGKIEIVQSSASKWKLNNETPEGIISKPFGNLDVSDVQGIGGGQIFIRSGQLFLDNALILADITGDMSSHINVEVDGDIKLTRGAKISIGRIAPNAAEDLGSSDQRSSTIAVPVCIKYNFRGNVESSFVHLKE